ncbi:T9SS type A sorting domain-containing protein [Rufibacter immobilis]|uniref:T9SS type A sorting domain-containing protein n=1 Tax=Rufibacter immobilis TaxID=1348778 RepID=UPI0035E90D18
MRFSNATGKSLTNIGLEFVLQQWYDGSAVTSLVLEYRINEKGSTTGNWTAIASLRAPVIANGRRSLDGTASANQKAVREQLGAIVLEPNQELTIRWVDAAGGGKDLLSIDNFKLTTAEYKPQPKVFYSNVLFGTELSNLASWNTDGIFYSGEVPTSFTAPNQIFIVQNSIWYTPKLSKSIELHPTSKLVIGTGREIEFNVPANVSLEGVNMDLAAGATVTFNNASLPILGDIDPASTVIYKDGSTQVKEAKYGNLIFDITSGLVKKLTRNIVVSGQLELKNGAKLELGNYDVVLEDSKKAIIYDAQSFVVTKGKGRLRMRLAAGESAVFPVGLDKVSPVKLQLKAGSVADTFSVHVIDGVYTSYEKNLPGGISLETALVNKTWIIDEGIAGGTNLDMTLQWTATEMIGAQPEQAFLMHYHQGAWDEGNASNVVLQNGVYSVTRTNITSFSPFAVKDFKSPVGQTPGTLPVELTHFQARRVNQQIQLDWGTASEKDNDYFTIEQSLDGVTFKTVGQPVKGAGNSAIAIAYKQQIADASPAKTQYFRLKQTDFDGTTEYSKVVALGPVKSAVKVQLQLSAYPNPSLDGKVSLVSKGTTEEAEIAVFHSTGKLLFQKQVSLSQPIELDLAGQTSGMYLVQVKTATAKEVIRVVKQ